MNLAKISPQYREIYLLVVRKNGQTLAVNDMAMLKALVTEVLRPSTSRM